MLAWQKKREQWKEEEEEEGASVDVRLGAFSSKFIFFIMNLNRCLCVKLTFLHLHNDLKHT